MEPYEEPPLHDHRDDPRVLRERAKPPPRERKPVCTLHHPRILCLHGGGTNALIFKAQMARLTEKLSPHFRLVFANAPFESPPISPLLAKVYNEQEFGSYRRWLRFKEEHPDVDAADAVRQIDASLKEAIDKDNAEGADGELVGVLGFSQGGKLAASLLYRQQIWEEKGLELPLGLKFNFAVTMAGREPVIALGPKEIYAPNVLPDAGEISSHGGVAVSVVQKLKLPTLHVHGLLDEGLPLHQGLLDNWCEKSSASVMSWYGDHRVPLKSQDIETLAWEIKEVARRGGVKVPKHNDGEYVCGLRLVPVSEFKGKQGFADQWVGDGEDNENIKDTGDGNNTRDAGAGA